MKPSLRAVRTVLSFSLATTLLGGCGNVGRTLKRSREVLVKVPIDKPIPARRSADGWKFRHVLEAPKDYEHHGQWYVAWNDAAMPESKTSSQYWRMLFSRAPQIAEATKSVFGKYPLLIEPNFSFNSSSPMTPKKVEHDKIGKMDFGRGVLLTPNLPRQKPWPVGYARDEKDPARMAVNPMWHFDDAHSGFAKAHRRIHRPGEGITIGHLDTGFDARHPAAPMNLVRGDWRSDAVGLLQYTQKKELHRPAPPDRSAGSHGLGTVGLLAGGRIAIAAQEVKGDRYNSYRGWLGGAPYAKVVPVQVAPWVVSFSTGEMAYAIDRASRVRGCDVLSMSHGGSPTQAWADAVNAAYERGTAMFAAEGDFFSLAFDWIMPRGLIIPSSPVYPAAFRRVIGVTGATAEKKSYARNSFGQLFGHLREIQHWAFRSSYGADGTSTSLFHPEKNADTSQTRWLGKLRAHPIAGYAPNVPWLSIREKDGAHIADGVDLDGGGASAATPQVAAAAALWLQKNRAELVRRGWWSDWHKAETVYHALLFSADRGGKHQPDPYLGAGLLKADRALDVTLAEIESHQRPPEGVEDRAGDSLYFDPKWPAPHDFFDGVRSLPGLFGLRLGHAVPGEDRAQLKQNKTPGNTRDEAMQRLYYNMLLLQKWHAGGLPREDQSDKKTKEVTRRHDESRYWDRAGHMAAEAGAKGRP